MRRLLVLVVIIALNGYSPPLPPSPRVVVDRPLLWVAAPVPVVALLAVIPVISS